MDKLILFASCILAVIADMCLVWWAKQPRHPIQYLIFGVIFNLIGLYIWAYSMKRGIETAMAITTYSLMTVAGCSFLGIVIFKEVISTINAIGILLAVLALILISI